MGDEKKADDKMERMRKLFGEDFVRGYQKKSLEARANSQKLAADELRNCVLSLQNLDPADQHTQVGDFDVVLAETPKKMTVRTLDLGSISISCLWRGTWLSTLFNDPDEAKKLVEGNFYILIGKMRLTNKDGKQYTNFDAVAALDLATVETLKAKYATEGHTAPAPKADTNTPPPEWL